MVNINSNNNNNNNNNKIKFFHWGISKLINIYIYNKIELKKFVDSCNGYYNDKSIKGWDIRCKKLNGDTFFFKYK